MHSTIQEHQTAIAVLCSRYRVRRLEVFGSAARGDDFDPVNSDADFLVEFDSLQDLPSLKTFFELRQELSTLLGRDVDLAETGAIRNPFVLASIEQSRELIYAA